MDENRIERVYFYQENSTTYTQEPPHVIVWKTIKEDVPVVAPVPENKKRGRPKGLPNKADRINLLLAALPKEKIVRPPAIYSNNGYLSVMDKYLKDE